jgi:hypothetical protein
MAKSKTAIAYHTVTSMRNADIDANPALGDAYDIAAEALASRMFS